MSLEFRQRTISEYLQMLWRQKWTILLPAIALAAAFFYVARQLPPSYKSTALLTVQPPTVVAPEASAAVEDAVSQRIGQMQKEATSRDSLEPLIAKYGLYENERSQGAPIESLIEKMNKNLIVEPEQADSKLQALRLTFKYRDAKKTQAVTSDLANRFVNIQMETSQKKSEDTKEFYEQQLAEIKSKLDAVERRRLETMISNRDTLPQAAQGLIASLEGLRNKQDSIITVKNQLIAEKGRLSDNLNSLNRQQDIMAETVRRDVERSQTSRNSLKISPAYAGLIQKRTELESRLEKLLKEYRDKHPDVVDARTQLGKVNDELKRLENEAKADVAEARSDAEQSAQLRVKSLDVEREQLKANVARIEDQISRQDGYWRETESEISDIQRRLNGVPTTETALETINREYQNYKTEYDQILQKKNNADVTSDIAKQNKGETIKIVDQANLPDAPDNSKRNLLYIVGLALGLGLGLVLAAVFEFPRLMTVQNIDDAKHYTGLPLLASIPELKTPREEMKEKFSGILKVMSGIILAVMSVPAVIWLLQTTKILERFVS